MSNNGSKFLPIYRFWIFWQKEGFKSVSHRVGVVVHNSYVVDPWATLLPMDPQCST